MKNHLSGDIHWLLDNKVLLSGNVQRNEVVPMNINSELRNEFINKLQKLMFEYDVVNVDVRWNGNELIKLLSDPIPQL